MLMYRDALSPRPSYERRSREEVKEKPVERKSEPAVSAKPEPRDPSPDTDAASSITMSDQDMSPRVERPESDIAKIADLETDPSSEGTQLRHTDNDTGKTTAEEDKPPTDHLVLVKEEVKRIEKRRVNDEPDGTDDPDQSPSRETSPVVEAIKSETVDKTHSEYTQKTEDTSTKIPADITILSETAKSDNISVTKENAPRDSPDGPETAEDVKPTTPEIRSPKEHHDTVITATKQVPTEAEPELKPVVEDKLETSDEKPVIKEPESEVKDKHTADQTTEQKEELTPKPDDKQLETPVAFVKEHQETSPSDQSVSKGELSNDQKPPKSPETKLESTVSANESTLKSPESKEGFVEKDQKDQHTDSQQETKKVTQSDNHVTPVLDVDIKTDSSSKDDSKQDSKDTSVKDVGESSSDSAVIKSDTDDKRDKTPDTEKQNGAEVKDASAVTKSDTDDKRDKTPDTEKQNVAEVKDDSAVAKSDTAGKRDKTPDTEKQIDAEVKADSAVTKSDTDGKLDKSPSTDKQNDAEVKADSAITKSDTDGKHDKTPDTEKQIETEVKDETVVHSIQTTDEKSSSQSAQKEDQATESQKEPERSEVSQNLQTVPETEDTIKREVSPVVETSAGKEDTVESITKSSEKGEPDKDIKTVDIELDVKPSSAESSTKASVEQPEEPLTTGPTDVKTKDPSPSEPKLEIMESSIIEESVGKTEHRIMESEPDTAASSSVSESTYQSEKSDSAKPELTTEQANDKSATDSIDTKPNIPNEFDALKSDKPDDADSKKSESVITPEKTPESSKSDITTPTTDQIKTESSQPIKKPDSLPSEPMEKTEDKVLETVVTSKVIEKSPKEQTLLIEASPTKELPEPFPDESKGTGSNQQTDSKTENKPSSSVDIELSKSTEAIEDDKTPDDNINEHTATINNEQEKLNKSQQETVPLMQAKQSPEQSNLEIVQPLASTEGAQHAEQTKPHESDSMGSSTESQDSLIKHVPVTDIDHPEMSTSVSEIVKSNETVDISKKETATVEISKIDSTAEQSTLFAKEEKASAKQETHVEQSSAVIDKSMDVTQVAKLESVSNTEASSEVQVQQTASVTRTNDDISVSGENVKQVSTTDVETRKEAASDTTTKDVSSVENITIASSTDGSGDVVKHVSETKSESSSAASSAVSIQQTSSTETKQDTVSISQDDVKQASISEIKTKEEATSDLNVTEISSVEQTKAVSVEHSSTVTTQDSKHDDISIKTITAGPLSPEKVEKESVVLSNESSPTELSVETHVSKTIPETNQIVNGHTQDDTTMEEQTKTKHESHDSKTEEPKVTDISSETQKTKTDTVADQQQSVEPKVNGEDEKTQKPEGQTQDGLNEKIEKLLLNGEDSQVSMKMMRGEVSAKTTYQRTSTGPIAISEVAADGKYIVLENTSSGPKRQDVNLDGWKLRRTVDGARDYIYNFRNFTLKPGKSVKILARSAASEAGLNDLVFRDEDSWGFGSQVKTCLINDKSEEKASHVQKTLYN